MNLYEKHLTLGESIKHERVAQMESRNLKPEYVDIHAVPSESMEHAYLVAKVDCLNFPQDVADVVEDQTEIIVCSCDDYYYNQSAKLDVDRKPSDCGICKHGRAAYKSIKAAHDNKQQTL